ncbi:MAG TPA: hypothetical protein VEJ89_02480 [Myxococcaceae bacterium]|nr:hypothetical protein [Myxococcaceae bacterium]
MSQEVLGSLGVDESAQRRPELVLPLQDLDLEGGVAPRTGYRTWTARGARLQLTPGNALAERIRLEEQRPEPVDGVR